MPSAASAGARARGGRLALAGELRAAAHGVPSGRRRRGEGDRRRARGAASRGDDRRGARRRDRRRRAGRARRGAGESRRRRNGAARGVAGFVDSAIGPRFGGRRSAARGRPEAAARPSRIRSPAFTTRSRTRRSCRSSSRKRRELFPAAGEALRAWRRAPHDLNAAQQLRRTLHTFKGSARMAGAMRLGELTHLMESRLSRATSSRLRRPSASRRSTPISIASPTCWTSCAPARPMSRCRGSSAQPAQAEEPPEAAPPVATPAEPTAHRSLTPQRPIARPSHR